MVKANRPFSAACNNVFPQFISPNYNELVEILKAIDPDFRQSSDCGGWIDACAERAKKVAEVVDNVIVTLGEKGVLVCRRGAGKDPFFDVGETGNTIYRKYNKAITCTLYAPEKVLREDIVNSSGAGDCFAAGFIAAMLHGVDQNACVRLGFRCSAESLKSTTTVPNSFQCIEKFKP